MAQMGKGPRIWQLWQWRPEQLEVLKVQIEGELLLSGPLKVRKN